MPVRFQVLCSLKMPISPLKTSKEADLVADFTRPHPGPGDTSVTAAPKPAFDVAEMIAENVRMYREAEISTLDSPVAFAKTAVSSSTPATKPKPPRPTVVPVAAESVPDFLKNTDLHGLEPALSVRTRILLACHAMNRMNMQLDIAKSFAIAGYLPRVRCVYRCVTFHQIYMLHSDQQNSEHSKKKWLLRTES